jgi:predicted Zn-dependent protease
VLSLPGKFVSRLREQPILAGYGLALLLFVGLGVYHGTQRVRCWYHERAARQALEEREFRQARDHLGVCLSIRPGQASLRFLAARAARRDGDLPAAAEHLQACQELGDVTDDTTLEWALLQAQSGKLNEVEDYLTRRLREDSADTFLIVEVLSWEYMMAHRLPEARRLLESWLQRRPEDVEALIRRGWVAEHLFDFDTALSMYGKALEHEPERDNVRLRIAEILVQKKRGAEALEQLRPLRQRQPENSDVTILLARCLREMNQFEEARPLLDDLIARQPRNAHALSERGMLALKMQQSEQAEVWLRQAVELDPYDKPVNYNLFQCLQQLDKKEEAAKVDARLQQIDADLKRMGQVVQDVMRKPHDPSLRHEAGMIFLRNGFTEDGLRWLNTALQEDPDYRPTHEALADYYERAGQEDLAARHRRFLQNSEVQPPPP